MTLATHPAYVALARKRVETDWPPFQQPEDFGYDFRDWVSPYTKGANQMNGIAIVLQDWASADGLQGPLDGDVQRIGRTRSLLTNRRLENALKTSLGLRLDQTFATNVFPFIKPGGMSANLRLKDLVSSAESFTKKELEIVQPKTIVALGVQVQKALGRAGIDAIALPHPAARGMSGQDYCELWQNAL